MTEHSMGPAEARRSWLGRSIPRLEDGRFLTGTGQYVDDISVPGMLHAAMLRSPYAHARIVRIDYRRALEMPGVHGVITGEDVAAVTEPEKGSNYPSGGSWRYIATDRARFAGEIVAIVAAEDRYVAEDALDAIDVEYEVLPVVSDPEHATDPDQPLLHPEAPGGNAALDRVWEAGDVERAFAEADIVARDRFVVHRHSSTPLEGLAAIVSADPSSDQVTVWANIGNLGRYTATGQALRLDYADIRLIIPDVGGSFGVKAWVHQRAVLLAILSRKVGRPVKWIEDRLEHLRASHHGHGRINDMEIAAKRDGTILGIKMRFIDDQGAYVCLNEPAGLNLLLGNGVISCYGIENVRVEAKCVLTNKCPVASNRGYMRVQPVFAIERIIDRLAQELRLDPLDLRLKNCIPASAYPYRTPSGAVYDSGDPSALLRKARELLDYERMRMDQASERARGRLLGVGVAMAVELGGPTPIDTATVRLGPDGRLGVQVPTLAQGQGHETTAAQIVADRFDVEPSSVHVTVQLDSRTMAYTPVSGTYASKFSSTGAPAVHGAALKLSRELKTLAANVLDADPERLEFRDGWIVGPDGPDQRLSLRDLATQANRAPESMGSMDVDLQATFLWSWPNVNPGARAERRGAATFTVLCHGAIVEVDTETGAVKVLKYVSVEDCGRLLNPMIVQGQTMGGVVNGLGWALTERFAYDESGQLLTGTFMDYLLPRFTDIPELDLAHVECPTPFSPLGAKGMGEGGSIPPMACIAAAVEDAILHLGARIRDSHLSPETVLRAIRSGASPNVPG
ncbi:MAG TPA: xanthine dehydrogenase family protein molybdopterin-binding subunit [Chloroflexota bacterium]|nr:xanthine dehydrogenase family protein molybdopterin-binding subunit [Chloroflexota bacterium]